MLTLHVIARMFMLCVGVVFLCFVTPTVPSFATENMYMLPFKAGTLVRVTQSCIDGYDAVNCAHSGLYSKRYSVDFSCRDGELDILAMADGVLFESEFDRYGYGHYAKILHENGQVTMYAHLANPSIGTGPVKRGQKIGNCGNTGNSTGRHLHIELRADATRFDTIPFTFFECIDNTQCINNQVYFPHSYVSQNMQYFPDKSFVRGAFSTSICFKNLESFSHVKVSRMAQEIEDCLMQDGYLRVSEEELTANGLNATTSPLSLKSSRVEGSKNADEDGNCKQLILFTGYTVGYGNETIYALQQCLISQGFLTIPKPTGYFGNLTRDAMERSRKELYGA